MSASIHKFSSQASRDASEQNKRLIKQIASCLNEELSELLGRMFDGADDMLFQLAENADSNEDQNQYFDAMRMLRTERSNITQHFASNLKSYLKPSNSNQTSNDEFDEDELSLVDQEEMEEMVAVSAMHSKAMNLYGDSVHQLEARIEFLSMKSTNIFDKGALAPKNICESFKDALKIIELSTNNKLVLYKLFDQEVILNLATLYQNLNQLFIDQGILPQIKLDKTTGNKSPQHNPVPATAPASTEAVYNENPSFDPSQTPTYNTQFHNPVSPGGFTSGAPGSDIQQSVNHVVSQFIHGDLTASGPGIPASFTTPNHSGTATGTQYYDRRDVMQALSNLQNNVAQSSSPIEHIDVADFKRALLADMGSRSGGAVTKQVNQVDEKTIDFIEMLFDAIVEDESISEPVTNLLLRLQIPVIKIAMLDKDFFANGEHPCRTTLNLVAHLGRGIISREDELFISLDQAVDRLLNDFEVDIISFEKATQHLEQIEQDEIKKAAEIERKTQKTILQTHARDVVLMELQFYLQNKKLPKQAHKLILKHWSTLMFHRYIKFGKNSDEWKGAVISVKDFINLLQPVESSQSYHKLNSERDLVLDNIHRPLLDTKQNPVEIETQINSVHLLFDEMLSNSEFNPENSLNEQTYFISVDDTTESQLDDALFDDMPEPEIELTDEIIDPLQEKSDIARQKIAKLPTEVRPGVWFEVYNGEDKAVRRTKLSVIIMEEAKLIFVDRVGVKVLEKDAEEFSKEIEDNKSQIISDHSAFDHALGLVINSLSGTNELTH